MRGQPHPLPTPMRDRWQPLRSGFVNLYRYDREEFHFENGRLLLRGNNGTGKSRILALQLPFLLDGDVQPARLEPDADSSKKIEWNLLMDRYPDRTGYTWIEFGRCESDRLQGRADHFVTLGCGLRAIAGQPGVRQWLFITTQRIGKNLDLVSDSGQVLTKDRLREKIGSSGQVFDSAGPYRRAVNEALFQLDEFRYASLVNLLIQLRRPQLTRQLDENELSRSLSEALPPVASDVIATLAEAFSTQQSEHFELTSSKTALTAVEQFLTGYRLYARVGARRRADRVLAAHDEYEAGMKDILAAEADCDRALAELARLKTELQRISLEEHALEAELTAFDKKADMKDAHALEQLQRQASESRKNADVALAELAAASAERKQCVDEHISASEKLEDCKVRGADALKEATSAVSAAGLEESAHELTSAAHADLIAIRQRLDDAIQTQLDKLNRALALNESVRVAEDQFQRAMAEKDQLSGLFDDAREHLNQARGEHQKSITAFLSSASDWTANLTELPLPFDQDFLNSVTKWCDRPSGPNPFVTASRNAVDGLTRHFAETRATLSNLEKTHSEELARLESQPDGEPQTADAESRLDAVLDSLDELNRRETALRMEADAAPAGDTVRAAYEYSVALTRHNETLRRRVAEAEQYSAQKRLELDEVRKNRDDAAGNLGILRWVGDLEPLKNSIARCQLALASFWPALDSLRGSQAATERAWSRVEQATARENRYKDISGEFERRAVAAETARDAAGRVTGEGLNSVLARVAQARRRLEQLRVEEKEVRRRYHDTELSVTRVDERLRNRTEILTGHDDRRNTAAASLMSFASTGLLHVAVPELAHLDSRTSSTMRIVEAAFELVSRLAEVDAADPAWEQHQKNIPSQFNTVMQVLSAQGCRSSATFHDDVFVATAVFAGDERRMDELRQILDEDVDTRQKLLDARQREILENHLVGKVSSHLRDLLHAAEEQVRQMNVELDNRPMSTGLKLRFIWRASEDAPPGTAEARQRLMQPNDKWTLADQQALASFLQQQIQSMCSDCGSTGWQEALAEALDYRKWHWFGVERYQDGVWKRLTRRTHGTGSGGEKAVALTLPHFAAAAAFYRSAGPLAPRLILLDEAFVGIDADMRAKCMGLIHTFDLDFIMTSEREWGCYQTLPGLAIYQLSTRPGIDAVGLTRWVWNGRQRNFASPRHLTAGAVSG